jgi:hypothetical protein
MIKADTKRMRRTMRTSIYSEGQPWKTSPGMIGSRPKIVKQPFE